MTLYRLPKGGDMYLSLVTMLGHAMLTSILTMKQRVGKLCHNKATFLLLTDHHGNSTLLSQHMEWSNALPCFRTFTATRMTWMIRRGLWRPL